MRLTVFVALTLAATPAWAPAPVQAPAPGWTVNPARSTLRFEVDTADRALSGDFARWTAAVRFGPDNLAGSSIHVRVPVGSLRIADADARQIAVSADWLSAMRFPEATFRSQAVTARRDGRYDARGVLTVRGVARPATVVFAPDIRGRTARIRAELVLDRLQFGLGQGQSGSPDLVGRQVTVRADILATRTG